jgi:hypothetical protein
MSEQITTIPRNSKEKIVFSVNEFKGKHYLDMRIFQIPENGGQDIPTKKGLTIPVHLYSTFKDTLQSVDHALISRGLVDREDLELQR